MPLHTIITAAKTVSRARPAFSRWRANHDGDDQRDLNDCDSDGEYKCPERFAGSKGDHLSVINGSENSCD